MNRKVVRFGDNIKILRNRVGLTQEQLAEKIPVTRQTVSAWEKHISSPDINVLASLSEMFNIPTDELIFGKMPNEEDKKILQCVYEDEETEMIRSIRNKGFYDILEEDLEKFFPIIYLRFARIMGIALELKERGYKIVSIYSNGFSIYFDTDEEAINFHRTLYDVIDAFMHHEVEKTVVEYSEMVQNRIDEVEISVIKETHKKIFGAEADEMFYWVDEYDRIRGYGMTKEECREQAKTQECEEYNILHE